MVNNKKNISGITAIDGAILADFDGKCFAIGAILDGESIQKGDVGRGSRCNSFANYVQWISEKYGECCFAVIISEDKMINIELPDKKVWKKFAIEKLKRK